jgi:peroxiredoxin
MPEVGDMVPPFETMMATGKSFRFPRDLQMPFSVLVVYRKNLCGPCKIQLSYLRDAYPLLLAKGTQIITLSYPPPEESAQIAVELKLPYPILCDPEGNVLKLLEAINTDKLISGGSIHSGLIYPTILIVDQKGMIYFKLVTKKTATEQEFTQVNAALEKLRSNA